MAYTDIDDPSEYFQTVIWTGNDSNPRTILHDGNSDMQPDWLWHKLRSGILSHMTYDSTRGVTKRLHIDQDVAEAVESAAGTVTAFTSDGFTVDAGTSTDVYVNDGSRTYVSWGWKANGGTTSSNTDGSITSTVQVNQEAGFSIGTYTGTGSELTVGHGLGAVPKLHITKKLNAADAWNVYHESIGNTHGLRLNSTDAKEDFGFYGDTSPTSSVFTVGGVTDNDRLNTNGGSYVFYSFAEKQGYSKIGSYVGNGSTDGTFVYTGFKPAWVMCKSTASTSDWYIYDNKREGYNVDNDHLLANSTAAEATADEIDMLSNGFKLRIATDPNVAEAYVYMAFAEHPFVSSAGVPTTAR